MEKRTDSAAAGDAQGMYGTLSVNTADMSISHNAGSAGNIFSLNAGELSSSVGNMQLNQGELIASMSQGEPEVVIEYAYDAAGLRTQKKVTENGITITTDYFLHGKLLTHLTQGNDELHFYYDAQCRPQMVKYNGNYYSYQHNLQGDILAIVDRIGTVVVEYGYDAWGQPTGQPTTLSSSATPIGTAIALSKLNPFRYRGYIYDEETRLYYLRSRYYNPGWGRFVNEDSLLGETGTLLGHNIFAYCENSPVKQIDPSGTNPLDAIGNAVKGWINDTNMRGWEAWNNPSAYTVGDYITQGLVSQTDKAWHPEKPFSAEHWRDSFWAALGWTSYGVSAYTAAGGTTVFNPGTPDLTKSIGYAPPQAKPKYIVDKVGKLDAVNTKQEYYGIRYGVQKGSGYSWRSFELHNGPHTHFFKGKPYIYHWQENKWSMNPATGIWSVSSHGKHWTWYGRRIG